MITALPRIAIAVHDFGAAVETFGETFGMPVLDFSDRTVPDLGAHVGMCMPAGGSNIELMAPSDPDAPLSRSLQKFLDRFGDGLYALMLEAPDPNAEAEELAERGLDVLPLMPGAGGRDLHPRSTHGVLIRVYPNDSVGQHEQRASAAPGLSGISKVVVATDDAHKAAAVYGTGLGLSVGPAVNDAEDGVVRVTCEPPKGGVIELVSAIDTNRPYGREIAEFVETRSEGMHTLVLETDDPAAAASTLSGRGLTFEGEASPSTTVFGTRFVLRGGRS